MEMPTHIVAVGGLVTKNDGTILLVKNSRRGWEFPGGQVENGESLIQAVIREIKEESGIIAKVKNIVGIYSNTSKKKGYNGVKEIPTIVNIDFICQYISGELTLSEETIDNGWFTREEAVKLVTYEKYKFRLKNMLNKNNKFYYYSYKQPYDSKDEFEFIEKYEFE